MNDTFSFTLESPLTKEQFNLITDAEFEHTDRIWFYTPKGKHVEFVKAQQWIPCSERLPEESDRYICTCKDGIRTIVTYVKWQNKFKRWDLTGTRSYWKVIAWMRLPEPYKEEPDD